MSPEDDAQPTPDSAPERSAEAPSEPVTSDAGAADLESPTSWAAPAAEGSTGADGYGEGEAITDAETPAPDAGTTEVDEPASYDADPYEPATYEAGTYEAAAYDADPYEPATYEAETYEAAAYDTESYEAEPGPEEGYEAEEPDPVAVPARRPPARRPPARRPAARRQAARPGRAPARRRPGPAPTERAPQGALPAGTPPNRRRAVILLSVATVAVVVLAIWGISLGRDAKDKARPPASTAPPTTLTTLPDEAFVTFRDPETNFSIRYPRTWRRTEAPIREIRLQVTDGKQFACRVQVIRTEQPTTAANVANLVPVMHGIIGQEVQILSQDSATVNGLIGFRFVYTVVDEASGLEEAHLHYFLFQGHKMNSIVFAAVPSTDFAKIEGVFLQMLESFRSEPDPEPDVPPTSAG